MSKLEDHGTQRDLEVERNELMRLMGTAKNDDRKAIIRDSLMNLESPDRIVSPNKKIGSAAMKALRHNNIFDTEKIAAETVFLKSPPIRPMSARLRRSSMNNLDVIQEEKRLSMSLGKTFDLKDHSLVDIQLDDVCEISASCCDPRLSHWNPFSKPSSSRWVSTGMMPQFLAIDLKLSWLIMEVKIKCTGLKSASISIEGSLSKIPLKKENSTTFSFLTNNSLDQVGVKSSKVYGDKVILILEESSEIFVVMESIYIRAVPTG